MNYKIFCDESNHLLTDDSKIIVKCARSKKTPSFNSEDKGLLGDSVVSITKIIKEVK